MTTPALNNVNGATYRDGKVYLATNGGNVRGLYRLDATSGKAELLLNNYRARRLNSPNDLIFDTQSNILFTDPWYGWINGFPGVQEPELPTAIYHFNTATRALTPLHNSLLQMPNGLALSRDESTLYVADSNSSFEHAMSVRNVWAFDYNGKVPMLSNPRLIYQAPSGAPDGLRVTESGLLMATGTGGIDVINPSNGQLLGKINAPDDIIYNLEPIAGKGVWMLTGGKHIWKVTMKEGGNLRGTTSQMSPTPTEYLAMLQDYIVSLVSGGKDTAAAGKGNHGDL